MSRKIHFDGENPRHPDTAAADSDTLTRQRKKQRLEHEDLPSDTNAHTRAAPHEPSGAALSPPSGMPFADKGVIGTGGLSASGLGHGAANFIRSVSPDETPDRNAAVSATRFAMDAAATSLGEMSGGQTAKRKSKLKEKDSSLKFGQDEAQGDNDDAPSQDDGAAEPSDDIPSGNADEPEQALNNGEAEQPQNCDDAGSGDGADGDDTRSDNDTAPDEAETPRNGDSGNSAPRADADAAVEKDAKNSAAPDKPKSKLKFTKDEKKADALEKRADKLSKKSAKAKGKLPTKKVKKEQYVFDEKKGKAVSKLTHEKETVPIGEAKWNNPADISMPLKAASVVTAMSATKIHAKVHQLEHDNVGVQAAHNAELLAESGYKGAKRTANSAYRFHKNRPYRRVAKLEQKSIKSRIKLDYNKVLRDNPQLKSSPLSRFMQKRAIKRNYAKDLRNAKKAAKTGKEALGFTAKAGKAVTNILRKNPAFWVKAGLLALIAFLIMSLLSMCMGIFSGGSAMVGGVSYAAEDADIDSASILYTELETDLQVEIANVESTHSGYDEYRYQVGDIGHDPLELMAFLTAVYEDFAYADVEPVLRGIFNEQYTLTLTPEVEIRTRTEERTGTDTWTDEDGNTHSDSYTYTVEVEYEWHILNVVLASQPFTQIAYSRMAADQTQHFGILMMSKGARQFVANPFGINWLPYVTSLYGYRVHPITGVKDFHSGLDIALPTGTPIQAGFDGFVVAVGYDAGGYGNYVVIENSDGLQARYAHCDSVSVSSGQTVAKGDVIATVGNTGASTGAHLHIEVAKGGELLNPIYFVETGDDGSGRIPPGMPGGVDIPDYPGAPMDDARYAALMEEAMTHLGKPYVFGASGPNSFDCSGFVSYVLSHSVLPGFGRASAQGLFNQSTPVSAANAQPGDLIFFHSTYSTSSTVTHVGIYIGGGMMIHAGKPIQYTSINTAYWQNHFYAFGRI